MDKIDKFASQNNLTKKEIELLKKFDGFEDGLLQGKKNIAFIHEETNHLSGGRYYSWFIISALVAMGHDVTVYTNRRPTFMMDLSLYPRPKLKIFSIAASRLSGLNIQADLYMGSPIHGAVCATRLAKKYNKKAICLVFDPFPMMKKYLGNRVYSGWDELIRNLKEDNVYIFALCKETKKYIIKWLNKKEHKIYVVYPCINSKILYSKKRKYPREDYVIFISRIVANKRFEDVLNAVAKTDLRLKVVSSITGLNIENMLNNTGMKDRTDFYWKASDTEKFDMIAKSRGVINGAIFEGFGMYLAEAIATGTPAILYDYPTFREIEKYSGVDNIYFARPKDVRDLSSKLKKCIKEEKFRNPSNKFDFERMIESLNI